VQQATQETRDRRRNDKRSHKKKFDVNYATAICGGDCYRVFFSHNDALYYD